jgi:diguanylate cyclase (GGDEF)-like protein
LIELDGTDIDDAATSATKTAFLRAALDGLCVPGVLSVVTQPVVRLADLSVVGYEALARMPVRPRRPPDWWLDRASAFGMRPRVEIACWRAISEYGPPPADLMLFVNASPVVLAEPGLLALRDALADRLVIEVTEQEAVADYKRLRTDLVPWLTSNARLAIDDTGAGHSSLRHVIELSPDFLKIDRSLVSNVDKDRNRRALVHSLVAFATEVGCTVIAEGVETIAELETLRDAQVHLVQGFLFGTPSRPWPDIALGAPAPSHHPGVGQGASILSRAKEEERLRTRLGAAFDVASACDAVVEYLFRRGNLLPSIYLERQGQLRCIAQRGLWQILDGMTATSGITGTTWATGKRTIVHDVREHADYLEAIPGVISEACVPLVWEGETVGALNVESTDAFPPGTIQLLERCVRLLISRLGIIGWRGPNSNWQRAARASVAISELAPEKSAAARALEHLRSAAGMDSAGLILHERGKLAVAASCGPLASVLDTLPATELQQLTTLVDEVSSCYTGNDTTGHGFAGTESLRAVSRAVIVLPLRSGGSRWATVVLAHSRPRALSGDDVEPLELVAAQFAATLSASSLVTRLLRQAHEDRLTRLGNRGAFEELLDATATEDTPPQAALILDIDHFKLINDEHGHLVGDEALHALAQHLRTTFPDIDLYRYGGDEFAVLVDASDPEAVAELSHALCDHARHALAPYGSSVTAGLAVGTSGTSPRALFAEADAALLWAKRNARGTAADAATIVVRSPTRVADADRAAPGRA